MQQRRSGAAPVLSRDLDEHGAGDEGVQWWLAGLRWRRRVGRALAPLKLTLTEWLVLDALARLIRESRNAVSQIQVGRLLEMNKTTVCHVMQRLERTGFVDQAPEFGGNAYRIYLTERGRNAAREGRLRVDTASAAWRLLEGRGG
jgi:DNA-binding MarR family transcriptional regulator